MSLDVYLHNPVVQPGVKIFVDEEEIPREEWGNRFPQLDPYVLLGPEREELYWANITHNLSEMAGEAGVYKCMWRPADNGIAKAGQLIEPLRAGLRLLMADPKRFRALSPKNGWGSYEGLVGFIENYLDVCERNPEATVTVSR